MKPILIPVSYMIAMADDRYEVTGKPDKPYSCWTALPVSLEIKFGPHYGWRLWDPIPLTIYERFRPFNSNFFGYYSFTPIVGLITIG